MTQFARSREALRVVDAASLAMDQADCSDLDELLRTLDDWERAVDWFAEAFADDTAEYNHDRESTISVVRCGRWSDFENLRPIVEGRTVA